MSKKVEQALAPSIPPKVREYIQSIIEPEIKQMSARIEAQAEFILATRKQFQEDSSSNKAEIRSMERLLTLMPKDRGSIRDLMNLLESQAEKKQ